MSSRYVVFSVGCLECTSGDSVPEISLETDDLGIATDLIKENKWSSQVDSFIYDTVTRSVTSAHASI